MNQADTAWMLISTALVLLMTPALAFFYGGLVRSKNALNTMMMSFISLGFVSVAWALIGYSLNDTIVVFDRIRENFRVLRKADLIENINISTTQTLLRTLATSISTLLAIIALMVFGGENLWGFSLALFIGVTAGTYSSVYIASILLIWLKLTRDDLIPPVEAEEVDERP